MALHSAPRPGTPPPLTPPFAPLPAHSPEYFALGDDVSDGGASVSVDRLTEFEDVFARWTTANDRQRTMRDAVTTFVGNDAKRSKVLRVEAPQGSGKSTFIAHAAAAHLAASPDAVVAIITRDWKSHVLHHLINKLVHEVYVEHPGSANTSTRVEDDFVVFDMPDVTSDWLRRVIITDDPARLSSLGDTPLVLIDDSVLGYHDGFAMAQVASQQAHRVVVVLTPDARRTATGRLVSVQVTRVA